MRAAAATGLAVAAFLAGCGEDSEPRPDPFNRIEREFTPPDPGARAAPRWAPLRDLRGTGGATATVEIDPEAIQWRLRWTCFGSEFAVTITPRPPDAEDAASRCPGRDEATYIGAGEHELAVSARGRWKLSVEQQVDTPVREPALAGMTPRRRIAQGAFERVERTGEGSAALYKLPSGRLAVRLEGFVTEPNTDLFVWTSPLRSPKNTRQILDAPHRSIAELKATVGDQNYLLPASVSADAVASIVIWCEPVRIAYTAAPLRAAEER
ncbi:MAG: DM13 domain-containing protein [Solirubrobacteraceae bacterium]